MFEGGANACCLQYDLYRSGVLAVMEAGEVRMRVKKKGKYRNLFGCVIFMGMFAG